MKKKAHQIHVSHNVRALAKCTFFLASVFSFSVPEAFAQDANERYDFVVDQDATDTNNGHILNGDRSLRITNSGSIISGARLLLALTGDNNRVRNEGTLRGEQGISVLGDSNAFVNTGSVSTSVVSGTIIGFTGSGSSIENSGSISSIVPGGSQLIRFSRDNQGQGGGTFRNRRGGKISITSQGNWVAALITDARVTIENDEGAIIKAHGGRSSPSGTEYGAHGMLLHAGNAVTGSVFKNSGLIDVQSNQKAAAYAVQSFQSGFHLQNKGDISVKSLLGGRGAAFFISGNQHFYEIIEDSRITVLNTGAGESASILFDNDQNLSGARFLAKDSAHLVVQHSGSSGGAYLTKLSQDDVDFRLSGEAQASVIGTGTVFVGGVHFDGNAERARVDISENAQLRVQGENNNVFGIHMGGASADLQISGNAIVEAISRPDPTRNTGAKMTIAIRMSGSSMQTIRFSDAAQIRSIGEGQHHAWALEVFDTATPIELLDSSSLLSITRGTGESIGIRAGGRTGRDVRISDSSSLTAIAEGNGMAMGIWALASDMTFSVDKDAVVLAQSYGTKQAVGAEIGGNRLLVAGSVEAEAKGSGWVIGIYTGRASATVDLKKTAKIRAKSVVQDAKGIQIAWESSKVYNEGEIIVTSEQGKSFGIFSSKASPVIENKNLIETAPHIPNEGSGILAMFSGQIKNSGTILSGGDGIRVQRGGTIENTGKIQSFTQGKAAIKATGNTHIVNAGSILGSPGKSVVAIDLSGDGGDTLEFRDGSRISGAIKLGGDTAVTLRMEDPDSQYWIFSGGNITLSSQMALPEHAVVFHRGHELAIFDPSHISTSTRSLGYLADDVTSLIGRRSLSFGDSVQMGIWGSGGGSPKSMNKLDGYSYANTVFAAGIDGFEVLDGVSMGVAVGYNRGVVSFQDPMLDVGSDEYLNRSAGFLGAVYGEGQVGPGFVQAMFLAGYQNHDERRMVGANTVEGGRSYARADYDSMWWSPQLAMGVKIPDLVENLDFRPLVQIGYVAQKVDHYVETQKAFESVRYNEQDTGFFTGRAELGAEYRMEQVKIKPRAGIKYRSHASDEDVSVEMFAQEEVVGLRIPENMEIYAGCTLETVIQDKTKLALAAEISSEKENQDTRLSFSLDVVHDF